MCIFNFNLFVTVLTTSKQGDQAWLTFSSSILTLSPHPNLVQTLDVCEQEGNILICQAIREEFV